ncbi:MAG: LysM peptidoglycan-binding domain-containing M23 family metallopeptidase [Planctomycetota bacterium]|nr:LysM peptidoglycan-binding domain-containing M23 family metallopeptidase [Planctomycetota bacterium]MDA1138159.1 LysM peptidoglycan-binding domain-containing M23 family metallopeptidase [Planctomycetota bacterium]
MRTLYLLTPLLFLGCNHSKTAIKEQDTQISVERIDERMRVVLPREGVIHIVQQGETLGAICQSYGKVEDAIRKVNGLQGNQLSPGQGLFIPGASKAIHAATPVVVETSALPDLAAYAGPSQSGLIWPVKAKVNVQFRQQDFFARSDGINIAAPFAGPVWAAQSGVVAYQDDDLLGLGRVIVLQHEGGLYTLYGNLYESRVETGQQVNQGGVIARSGNSGRARQPQLHFRVYQNSTPANPITFLK